MIAACLLACTVTVSAVENTGAATEYLSDIRHRFLHTQQAWGELGIDTCAFQRGLPVQPLKIGEREYRKGLGHHAPGDIVVDLSGEYERFEAELGVQPLPACPGTVIFEIYVDDERKFESGVLRAGGKAEPVSVPVRGAMELRLSLKDAGDGITCDCANWAEARLVRTVGVAAMSPGAGLDAAPFGEVVTSDPRRMDGARSNRIQEYRGEDIYLETPVARTGGGYRLAASEGPRAIGLRWFERRLLRQIGIGFADGGPRPARDGIRAQCWVGESLWQGGWKPLEGELSESPSGWRLAIDWSRTPEAKGGTRKIRWILPGGGPVEVTAFTAVTPTRLEPLELRIQVQDGSGRGSVRVHNGELLHADGGLAESVEFPLDRPQAIKVRYARPRAWKTDRTILRFTLPKASFAVAVDDVVRDGGVYVRDAGLFVSLGELSRDLQGYLEAQRERRTVLDRVRNMPDQTLAQAIEHVHNPKQNLQPMLLSLACENRKYVVHRDGTVLYSRELDEPGKMAYHRLKYPWQVSPRFGTGKDQKISRSLPGGWLPAPITRIEEGGLICEQRTFVAPVGDERIAASNNWLAPQSIAVLEFTLSNPGSKAADARLALHFTSDVEKKEVPETERRDGRHVVYRQGRVLGVVVTEDGSGTTSSVADDAVVTVAKLSPGGKSQVRVYLPGWTVTAAEHAQIRHRDYWPAFESYWRQTMAGAAEIELPDPLLADVIRASQVHCLLAARSEAEGALVAPWIASFVYGPLESESNSIIRGMDAWGHHTFARRSLDFFISRYSPDGMLTTGYTLMGTGWHLWSLGEHFDLVRDVDWLKGVAPKVASVCEWIMKQRAKTKDVRMAGERPPEYGLAPPGVMADWNSFAYYFCLNGYYYKGLRDAAAALKAVTFDGADRMLADADAFREDILRAYHWTQSRMPVYPLRDGTSVPGYPSQLTAPGPTNNFFPGEDANRSWCYDVELGAHQLVPQGVLDPSSREVDEMMEHMEDVQFLSDGWFDYPAERNEKDWYNLGGFAKVQPYYCRNIEIYALRDDVKPFVRSYFNTIPSLLGFETLSFQEHFAGVAAWNKTHETGYFLHYSRLMLVQERGDELWLAPFVTPAWLADGKMIRVTGAPTRFGPVSYAIRSGIGEGRIDVEIDAPKRTPPSRIVVRLRHPESRAGRVGQAEGVPAESVKIEEEKFASERAARVVIPQPKPGAKLRLAVEYK